MKNNRLLKYLLIIAGAVVIILIMVIIFTTGMEKKNALRVGFIMTGTTTEEGWNKLHYDGIKEACDELDAKLLKYLDWYVEGVEFYEK